MHRWATLLILSLLLPLHHRAVGAVAIALNPQQDRAFAADARLDSPDRTNPCLQPETKARAPAFLGQACLTQYAAGALADLVQRAELIVRGQVTAIHSFWRADQRVIESDVTLAVTYALLGHAQKSITVRVPGGYLAAEGIGMNSMHAATFVVGEEVLLFAHQQESRWQVVNGAAGKFQVQGGEVANSDLTLVQSLDGLLPTVVELIRRRGLGSQLPLVWRTLEAPTLPMPIQSLAAQADARKWATPHASAPFYINLNTAQIGDDDGAAAAFRNAILSAAASWSAVASADFTLAYAGETKATQTSYNGINEVLFMHKGVKERAAAAQVWYTKDLTIVEADIWINDDYAWNATGALAANEVDLQSALLHEFGHWLVLGHFPDAATVMFPRLTAGTLKRTLQPEDIQGISAIYPY